MKIEFKWFGGGNWMIISNGIKMICDPVLCPAETLHNYGFFKSKRVKPPVFSDNDLQDVHLWLFTHGHKDHCDFWNYKPIQSGSRVIADVSASLQLKKRGYREIQVLKWQEKTILSFPDDIKIVIEAVPAIHSRSSLLGTCIGNGNGYLIDIVYADQTYSLYATGDTLPNRDTIRILSNRTIDIIVANVGNAVVGNGLTAKLIGRITMNMADLAALCDILEPKAVIPVHWDAFEHYKERNISEFSKVKNCMVVNQGEMIHLQSE